MAPMNRPDHHASHESPKILDDDDLPHPVLTTTTITTDADVDGRETTKEEDVQDCRADDKDDDHQTRQKRQKIIKACQDADISRLRILAQESGGFLDDRTRRKAWPVLLGQLGPKNSDNQSVSWRTLPAHQDEDQVTLDVKRAFIYYPRDQPEAKVKKRKEQLSDLILETLRRHPYLCYFQGYHDICQVLLLVLEPAWRPQFLARLSLLRIRDFMLPNIAPTVTQLNLLPEIIGRADPELRRHVAAIEPIYALAATLTMYAHTIPDYRAIVRLFDVLLSREPVFSIYLFAQIVLDRRADLLATPSDDTAMLHFILSKVPTTMDLDGLIAAAAVLYERHRPESLRSWKKLSRFSVFRTANSVERCARQTLDDGHRYFERHARELEWAGKKAKAIKAIWRHRRLLKITGSAVSVLLVALYLRRNQGVGNQFATILAHYIKWS